jgi:hypothetical protein
MSIHGFYSKLVSGKEEGRLFEVLRRLRKIEKPALAAGEEAETSQWNVWNEDSGVPFTAAKA